MQASLAIKEVDMFTGQEAEVKEPKKKGRPFKKDLKIFDYNPFTSDKLYTQLGGKKNVYYKKTTPTAILNTESGEIDHTSMLITKQIKADKETFVKLYSSHLKNFFELSVPAFKFLHYILYQIQKTVNSDKVYLSYSDAEDFYKDYEVILSNRSYSYAINEMLNKDFLARTKSTYIYYFNTNIFFNGDRINYLTKFEIERNNAKEKLIRK